MPPSVITTEALGRIEGVTNISKETLYHYSEVFLLPSNIADEEFLKRAPGLVLKWLNLDSEEKEQVAQDLITEKGLDRKVNGVVTSLNVISRRIIANLKARKGDIVISEENIRISIQELIQEIRTERGLDSPKEL